MEFWYGVPLDGVPKIGLVSQSMAHTLTAERTAGNVRAELARAGYTASEAARALNWSKSRMARRLSGEIPFDVAELAALSDLLGVALAVFVSGAAA